MLRPAPIWSPTFTPTDPTATHQVAGASGIPQDAIGVTGIIELRAEERAHATVHPAHQTTPETSTVNARDGEHLYGHGRLVRCRGSRATRTSPPRRSSRWGRVFLNNRYHDPLTAQFISVGCHFNEHGARRTLDAYLADSRRWTQSVQVNWGDCKRQVAIDIALNAAPFGAGQAAGLVDEGAKALATGIGGQGR